MKSNKDVRFDKLLSLLKSSEPIKRRQGEIAFDPFITRYHKELTVDERVELFKCIIGNFYLLDEYAYYFDFTKLEKEEILVWLRKKPIFALKYEKLSSKLFNKKELDIFINENRRKVLYDGMGNLSLFNEVIVDGKLDKDMTHDLVEIVYSGKKKVSDAFFKFIFNRINKGEIELSKEDYDKLISVKIMRELIK